MQVVQAHAEDFLQKMDSTVLARQLGTLGLIPQTVENEVLKSMNTKDANAHLLNHLKRNANEKGVTEVFRVASQEEGYPNMNAFAAMMLRTLQQGLYWCVYTQMSLLCTSPCTGHACFYVNKTMTNISIHDDLAPISLYVSHCKGVC